MGTGSLKVTAARPDDAAGILVVQHDCWIATYPNEAAGVPLAAVERRVHNYKTPERIAQWQEIIRSEHVVVARDNEMVIGFACAQKNDDFNKLTAIYVLPQYHGSGVAAQLMEASLSWLGATKDILVEVVSYNGRAIHFYAKHGFKPTGDSGEHDIMPTVIMSRPGSELGQD
jgi:ribosomal protein S18 acetylase RimI-like enzyme